MGYCDFTLASSIKDAKCGAAPKKGYEQIGLLIKREDIASYTIEDGLVTALTMKASKTPSKIYQNGQNPFTGTTTEAEVGTYDVHFNNNVQFVVLNGGAPTAAVVNALASGEFVAIITEKDKNDSANSTAHRVYGLENGLVLSAVSNDAYGDTFAGVLVTMAEQGAATYGLYLDEESIYTTLAGA